MHFTDHYGREKHSGLESDCQAELGALFQGLGVDLTGNCQQRLWYKLVLEESPQLPVVVQLRFDGGHTVDGIGPSDGESVLIRGESSGDLSNCCTFLQRIQVVHI